MVAHRVHVRRECHHPRVRHQHGTVQAYTRDGCRCDDCYAVKSKKDAAIRKEIAQGKHLPGLVPAGPTMEHLDLLARNGISLQMAGKLSGIDWTSLQRIRSGKQEVVQRITEDAVLGIRIDTVAPKGSAVRVDGTGTARRLHALVALGYPIEWIVRYMGLPPGAMDYVSAGGNIRWDRALWVRIAYDELWDTTPPDSIRLCERTKARLHAQKMGWPPPMAWDDDTIDDPNTPTPELIQRRYTARELAAEIEFLRNNRTPYWDVPGRLGYSRKSLVRRLYRDGRSDLARWLEDKSQWALPKKEAS